MKTAEELSALKEEVGTLNKKLAELTEKELAEVIGGSSGMDIAERVIRGDYGNGQERRDNLRAAGYDYSLVQRQVEERLGYGNKRQDWLE